MTAGDIYAVAGVSGTVGSAGDGGPATSAQLNGVSGIGTDPAGDLFISDAGDDMVQEVTATPDSAIPAAPGQTSSLSPAPGGITVSQPGGAQVTFYAQAGGTCTAPYQVAGGYCALPVYDGASLTDNTTRQTYTFIPSAGSDTYTYSWDGQLISEANPASDTLTITYQSPAPGSGACPATATSCETITAASGRALVIGSNGSGLVTSVTDPMGRTWDYGYTNANLTSVTDPMTNVTSYTYGAASTGNPLLASDLLTITSPDAQPGGPDAGDSTVNVYNAAGQVTSQTDPTGFKTTFNYCVNASSGNCMDAATGTGYVTVTDPDGNTTVYGYTLGTQNVPGRLDRRHGAVIGAGLPARAERVRTKRGYAARHRDRRRPWQCHDERLQRRRGRHVVVDTGRHRHPGRHHHRLIHRPEPGELRRHRPGHRHRLREREPASAGHARRRDHRAVLGTAARRDLDLVRYPAETSCTRPPASTSQAAAPPRTPRPPISSSRAIASR